MKFLFSILFIATSLTATAQAKILVGTYSSTTEGATHTIDLQKDGSFTYEFIEELPEQEQKRLLGKGNWTSTQRVIIFTTTDQDLNDEYTIDLNDSKARSTWKSPLSRSESDEKEHIIFFRTAESDLKNLKLYKQ